MIKRSMYLVALVCLLLLTSCGGPEVGEPFDGEVNDYDGVTMTVVEGTAMPGTVTVEVLNTTDRDIESGNTALFALQVEQDGQWYWLETRQDDFATTAEALLYPTDEPVELTFTWGSAYGSLSPGHYRLVKTFFEYRGPGDYTNFDLAASFTLD